ncbi:MAG: glycoside hydrolase family 31 protein [Ferruginibacter sp.]
MKQLFKIVSHFFYASLLLLTSLHIAAQDDSRLKVTRWEKKNNILSVYTNGGILQLVPYLDKTVQVKFGTAQGLSALTNWGVVNTAQLSAGFAVDETGDVITATTALYSIRISKLNSALSFIDKTGNCILKESINNGRVAVDGRQPVIKSNFILSPGEGLYGLGQYRDNFFNLRGKTRELVQFNTQVCVPVVLSTNGWGIFWDNASRTIFKDDTTGMSFHSDEGRATNFFVFIGERLDDLVQQYRKHTGDAPLMPKWALGYHQSRNRYVTQQDAIDVVKRMRTEKIPVNSIFIDYFFWGKYGMGSHHFDEAFFPEPKKMMDTFHKYNTKSVVTIWAAFDSGSRNYQVLKENNYLLKGATIFNGATIYDPFNPKAAAMYWRLAKDSLMHLGIDGWFLDGPEPDIVETFLKTNTYLGPAPTVRNLYSLYHSSNFYKGLLQVHPGKRPYIITRSGWASQQYYGTVVWSGDIKTTFDELKTQVTAGLNFTATGIPYWTTDIGGYDGGDPENPAYRELFVRWWQYGMFCPIFRSHGHRVRGNVGELPNELWAYGDTVQKICTAYDNFRYRLMPYIYSLAAAVTNKQYTPMRLLAFDFAKDKNVFDIKDQFMYGPAFLVNPVTDAGITKREVYLPKGSNWFDFWTAKFFEGGQIIHADAPIENIPVFVRAGSIIPFGPVQQFVDEKAANPVDISVYAGADGKFSLYEDEGESFNYKKGAYSIIDLTWNNATKELTIGKRKGSFAGMLKTRKFNVVLFDNGNKTGQQTKTITYNGNKTVVRL